MDAAEYLNKGLNRCYIIGAFLGAISYGVSAEPRMEVVFILDSASTIWAPLGTVPQNHVCLAESRSVSGMTF